jgi:hypothetical protein
MSGTRAKRPKKRSAYREAVDAEEEEVRSIRARAGALQFANDVTHLFQGNWTFNSKGDGKSSLCHAVWSQCSGLDGSILARNPALEMLMHALIDVDRVSGSTERQDNQIEMLLTMTTRMRSIHELPLVTVRLTLEAYRVDVPRMFWRFVSKLVPGLLLSETWLDDFIPLAMKARPPPSYEELVGVGASVFDNYQRRLLYKAQRTLDGGGYLYKMTNWATLRIPKHLADSNFDPKHACAQLKVEHNIFAHTFTYSRTQWQS